MDIRNYFTSVTPRDAKAKNDKATSEMNDRSKAKNKKRKEVEECLEDEEPIPKRRGRKKKVITDDEEPIPRVEKKATNKSKEVEVVSDVRSISKRKADQLSPLKNDDIVMVINPTRERSKRLAASPIKTKTPTKVTTAVEEQRSPVTRSRASTSPVKNIVTDRVQKKVENTPTKLNIDTITISDNERVLDKKDSKPQSKRPFVVNETNAESPIIFKNMENKQGIKQKHDQKIQNIASKIKTNLSFSEHKKEEPNLIKKEVITSQMFVDKYKPQTSKQLIGQQGDRSNAKKLTHWLMNWKTNMGKKPVFSRGGFSDDSAGFKAALLSGPPGIGKTTTAHVICRELGFDITELNASDARSKKSMEQHVETLLHNKVLSNFMGSQNGSKKDGSKHVLIMDEVDGMAGNEDRGGVQELIQLIKKTQIPIICICNDRSHPKIRSLVNYCYDLRFYKPTIEQLKAAMMSVCYKEKITVSPNILQELILSTNRDIRQVMHSISLLAAKDHDINKLMSSCSLKDVKLGPFDAIKKVFTSGPEYNEMTIKDKSDLFFMDYSLMPLFCFENYLKVHPFAAKKNENERLKLVAKSIDAMAFGDLIEREIRQNNNWSLLPVQAVFSTVMPSVHMNGSMPPLSSFPALLGKISAINRKDRLLQELNTHMSLTISGDKSSLNLDYLEPLKRAITQPLISKGNDGVTDVLEVLHAYNLLKEDMDTIIELSTWTDQKNPMTNVDSKTKAALTRAYNKDGELLPYDSQVLKKGKKAVAPVVDDDAVEDGDEAGEDEKDDDFALRAKKTKPAKKTKEAEPKPEKPKANASKRGRKKQ
ncbi:replication factor C subunit 1-like protein [Leptotrombidium deliense]|uniref:Replication factor C subunit 1-like protein n=1 Tax=Leptotrombidium deliense TaxID=299467 RepID=A0A443SGV0_9ACAR|nr:replication factor C subunit 1-like protein [Leptotrombidium deliense]